MIVLGIGIIFCQFSRETIKKPQYARSLNLLYVCCSRAKRNLVVLMLSHMTNKALDGAKKLFGSEYVTDLDKELIQYA